MPRSLRTVPRGAQTSEQWIGTANVPAGHNTPTVRGRQNGANMNEASSEVAAVSLMPAKADCSAMQLVNGEFLLQLAIDLQISVDHGGWLRSPDATSRCRRPFFRAVAG